jgi:hypothetical protein
VYDPPCLLKLTQNLFLKYDLQLRSYWAVGPLLFPKWKHILKIHELDKPNQFHVLYKLTDSHLNPAAQTALKVSLAAQVMSHTCCSMPQRWCLNMKLHSFLQKDFHHIILSLKLCSVYAF